MLPVAALSNFFQAPAIPIHNKLPAIQAVRSTREPQRSKSIYQRSRGLAEVIQMQLVELKKIHEKYKPNERVPVTTCKTGPPHFTRHATEGFLPSVTNTQVLNNGLHLTAPLKKPKESRVKILTPSKQGSEREGIRKVIDTKREDGWAVSASTTPTYRVSSIENTTPQPTSVSINTPQPPAKSLRVASTLNPIKILPTDTTSALNVTKPLPTNNTSSSLNATKQLSNDAKSLGNSASPLPNARLRMDPVKFAAIEEWIKSVELAHEEEGKCLQVLY